MSTVLKAAKIAGIGYIAYKLFSFKAVKNVAKTALVAKGITYLKDKVAK